MNNNVVKKIATITGWVALGISVILALVYYVGIGDDQKVAANVNLLMTWTQILLIIIIVFAFLIGPILSILTNPKSLVKGLVSLGVLGVVILLAFIFSKADVTTVNLLYEIEGLQQKLKLTEVGLISFYIIASLTILAILFSEIKSLLKL